MNAAPQGRILIADDDPGFRGLTRLLLEQHGYTCDTAASGPEVEACLGRESYDLLISDIDMPGNRDLQLVAGLPQLQAGLPVILATGAPSVQSAARSVGLAVAAYFVKPVEPEELLAAVRKAIERHRCFAAVSGSRQRLRQTCADFERIEASLRDPSASPAGASIQSYLDVTFQNALGSLLDLRRMVEAFRPSAPAGAKDEDVASSRPAVLLEALWETIAVLEKTKHSFKSKELGELRKRLEALLHE